LREFNEEILGQGHQTVFADMGHHLPALNTGIELIVPRGIERVGPVDTRFPSWLISTIWGA
jgi:hypothetical protein